MQQAISLINTSQIISVINKMLHMLDSRLVNHGERVAYIVWEMVCHAKGSLSLNMEKLMILSILHDIGAYKTEEIEEMLSFESESVWSHSIYGYLFLKYMSPMGDESEAILYHHLDYKEYGEADSQYLDYAGLIYLADRVDILINTSEDICDFKLIRKNSGKRFNPAFVELFFNSHPEIIVKALKDGSYKETVHQIAQQLELTRKQAFEYLKMMVFSVDFRSEYTVAHTINTTAISIEIARRLNVPVEEQRKLYLGALMHDVGKIAISPDILGFQGKLTPVQMEVMKKHVVYSRQIIEGLVDDEIAKIAYRHHEKLDGCGYPEGLCEADLTLLQQIAAVADIVSALTSKRSYKEAFPKQKTMDILSRMKQGGQLNSQACEIVIQHYDKIMEATDMSRDPILTIYRTMQEEYVRLNDKVQELLRQTVSS